MTDREELARAIGGVLFNVSNFPKPAQARLLGQDMKPLKDKFTDAILAAGFRKPAEPESEDQRIEAWEAIARHPFFRECYETDGTLLDAMLAKLSTPAEPVTVEWEYGAGLNGPRGHRRVMGISAIPAGPWLPVPDAEGEG
ncbi:hypothetical protein [Glaciibacter psychrotolerans]|uniref:Gluconate 2-dehydrogenase subunit 3 family protein n=1 Tax=Glaciibacter psychrotolerans TaxID=670054 RepID=A0A7Z0J584_9MICO|nr:hypothetical protein [Leifsonia psychrotolerans]NYJ19177.1 hypothetical protein [Leifsonia psychrotolerans]